MLGQTKAATGEVTKDVGGSGGTDGICQYSGPYKCSTHTEIIVSFQKGQKFHPCPVPPETSKTAAGHVTTWVMVREADAAAKDLMVQRGANEL